MKGQRNDYSRILGIGFWQAGAYQNELGVGCRDWKYEVAEVGEKEMTRPERQVKTVVYTTRNFVKSQNKSDYFINE